MFASFLCCCLKNNQDSFKYQASEVYNEDESTLDIEKLMQRKQTQLKDFNQFGDDVKEMSKAELNKLSRFEQFEKRFPFYKMDVNGFVLLIQKAKLQSHKDQPGLQIYEMEKISLKSLQEAFKYHKSWSALNDKNSELVRFLTETCEGEQNVDDIFFSSFKIRVLGLLWCDGNADEKSIELYDNMQETGQKEIACNDKDFKPNMKTIFDFASEIVFKWEPILSKKGDTPVSLDEIERVKDEKYDELCELFLDEVFGNESKLDKKQWIHNVIEKQAYLFNPKLIRANLGYKI